VRTVVVLLRREADADNLTGTLERRLPDGRLVVDFRYEVVRLWERPVGPLLAGDLGLLPLAPLVDVPREQVPEVIRQIDQRLAQEAPLARAGKIMNTTLMLAGLRLPRDEVEELRGRLQTVSILKESSYYQLLVEEGMKEGVKKGRIEEAQSLILRQGQIRFGSPDAEVRAAIEAIQDVERLEQLSERLLIVSSWAELLSV
jgi:predicted transposase YdaD